MLVLVGLGNPGTQHARQRHNIGFMAVDAIADHHGFAGPTNKFKAIIREGSLDGPQGRARTKAIIVKPQTYMNQSGISVGELVRFYKLRPETIIVFHDELDLAPAKLRVKSGGGNAGHNGLRSIDAHIGNNFTRIRLGIGRPATKAGVHHYVLGNFAKDDQDWLADMLEAIARATPHLASHDEHSHARFQSEIGCLMNPNPHTPKPSPDAAPPAPGPDTSDTPSPTPFRDALRKILPEKK